MYAKAVGNKMVTCGMTKWDRQPSNHTFWLLSKHSVSPHCANARRNRSHKDLNSCHFGEQQEKSECTHTVILHG